MSAKHYFPDSFSCQSSLILPTSNCISPFSMLPYWLRWRWRCWCWWCRWWWRWYWRRRGQWCSRAGGVPSLPPSLPQSRLIDSPTTLPFKMTFFKTKKSHPSGVGEGKQVRYLIVNRKKSPSNQATGCRKSYKMSCFCVSALYFLDYPFTVINPSSWSASVCVDFENNRLCHVSGQDWEMESWHGAYWAISGLRWLWGEVARGNPGHRMKYCSVHGVLSSLRFPLSRYIFRLEERCCNTPSPALDLITSWDSLAAPNLIF